MKKTLILLFIILAFAGCSVQKEQIASQAYEKSVEREDETLGAEYYSDIDYIYYDNELNYNPAARIYLFDDAHCYSIHDERKVRTALGEDEFVVDAIRQGRILIETVLNQLSGEESSNLTPAVVTDRAFPVSGITDEYSGEKCRDVICLGTDELPDRDIFERNSTVYYFIPEAHLSCIKIISADGTVTPLQDALFALRNQEKSGNSLMNFNPENNNEIRFWIQDLIRYEEVPLCMMKYEQFVNGSLEGESGSNNLRTIMSESNEVISEVFLDEEKVNPFEDYSFLFKDEGFLYMLRRSYADNLRIKYDSGEVLDLHEAVRLGRFSVSDMEKYNLEYYRYSRNSNKEIVETVNDTEGERYYIFKDGYAMPESDAIKQGRIRKG